MDLNEAEVLIALVLQDLCKESHIVLFFDISLDTVDYCSCPLHNERLQAILLIQVGVHELLERLFTHSVF